MRCSLAACQEDTSELPPKASTTLSVSSPNRRARATDTAIASAPNASHVLFTSFSRDPAPAAPTQIVRWPSASKRGPTRERASSGPEAKIVSWPCSAGTLLPETGASRSVTSGRSASTMAATRSIPSTPIVLICTQIVPGASAASMPWSRAIEMTASASVTIVTTISARRAASAAVSATSAPSSARSRVARGSRFQTIVGMPARSALVAIPCPIAPIPRNAVAVIPHLPMRRHPFGVWPPDRDRIGERGVDGREIVRREHDVGRRGRLIQMSRPPRPDDGHVDGRLRKGPRDRELRERDAALLGDLLQSLDDREVATEGFAREVRTARPPVVLRESRLGCHGSGKQPVRHRPVDEHADIVIHGIGQDLVFDLATEQVVRRLQGLHPAEASQVFDLLHVVVRNTDVADLVPLHQLLERPGGLLRRGVLVRPVDLVQVDVVRFKVPQARVHALPKPLAAGIAKQPVAIHPESALGCDEHVFSPRP